MTRNNKDLNKMENKKQKITIRDHNAVNSW